MPLDDKILHRLRKNIPTLTELDLRRKQISAAGAKMLGGALEKNTTLTTLSLYYNQISDDGAKALGEALEKNTTLTKLDLRWNQIGAAGTTALAAGLEKNTTLTKLDLYGNQISAAGAKALGKSLQHHSALTELDLGSNQIGAAGAKALGKGLQHNFSLTSLDLQYNSIRAEGAKALAKALEKNLVLTTLNVDNNDIGLLSQGIKDRIKKYLARNQQNLTITKSAKSHSQSSSSAVESTTAKPHTSSQSSPLQAASLAHQPSAAETQSPTQTPDFQPLPSSARSSSPAVSEEQLDNGANIIAPSQNAVFPLPATLQDFTTKSIEWCNRGSEYYKKKEFEFALSCYEKAIQYDNSNPVYWSNKAITLRELNRLNEAMLAIDESLRLNPSYPDGWFLRGSILKKRNALNEALISYEKAAQLGHREARVRIEQIEFMLEQQSSNGIQETSSVTNTNSNIKTAIVNIAKDDEIPGNVNLTLETPHSGLHYDASAKPSIEEAEPIMQASDTHLELSQRVQELEKTLNSEDLLKKLREIVGQEAANLFANEKEALAAVKLNIQQQRLELEQYKQSLDSKYQGLEAQIETLSKQKDAKGKIPAGVAAQIEQLREQQDVLMAKYYKKQQVLAEQGEISQFAELHSFYRIIQLKLNELFIACKAISSGKVTAERGKMGLAVDVIQIAGSAIPFGGGIIPAVFALVANTYIGERKGKQASQASEMVVSIREIEKLTEQVARLLTQRYANQLHLITSEGAQLLGECAVACILSSAAEGKMQANESLVEQMIVAVTYTPLKKGYIPFVNKTIPTKQKGSTWTDEGIFKRTGIQTLEGKYFSGGEARPDKYGYRIGTEQEALVLGLKQDAQKIEIAGIGLTPAAANQIKTVTAQHANLEKNIEFIHKAKTQKDDLQDKKLIELEQRNAEQDKQLKQQSEEIQQLKQMVQMLMQQNQGVQMQYPTDQPCEPPVAQGSKQPLTAITAGIIPQQAFFKAMQLEPKAAGVNTQPATNPN